MVVLFLLLLILGSNMIPVQESLIIKENTTNDIITENIDDNEIKNNGYINEVIGIKNKGYVEFDNVLLDYHPKLERSGCKLSKDLPIANVKIEHLFENGSYI